MTNEGEKIVHTIKTMIENGSTYLDLSNKNIGDKEMSFIAIALKNPGIISPTLKNIKITELNLENNSIGAAGIKTITSLILDKNIGIKEITLDKNLLNNTELEALHNIIQKTKELMEGKNPKLAKLTLDPVSLYASSEKGEKILEVIQTMLDNDSTVLDCSGQNIGDEGAKFLSAVLMNPEIIFDGRKTIKITNLNLENNNIGTAGMEAITSLVLDDKIGIRELKLGSNLLQDTDLKKLIKEITTCNDLEYVGINHNEGITIKTIKALNDIMSTNIKTDNGYSYLKPITRFNTCDTNYD